MQILNANFHAKTIFKFCTEKDLFGYFQAGTLKKTIATFEISTHYIKRKTRLVWDQNTKLQWRIQTPVKHLR